jgi:hypothetical protein
MFTVNVEAPDPVSVAGLKLPEGQVIPAGKVPHASATTPLKPLMLETVTVREALLEPIFTVTGETLMEKSCTVTLAVTVALSTCASELAVGLPVVVSVAVAVPFD